MTRRRNGSKQDEAHPIERRWLDAAAPAQDAASTVSPTDARIARMLSEIPEPPPLSPSRLAAVAARLPGRPLPTHLPRRQSIRLAIVLSFLLGSASAVFARKQIAQLWDQVTTTPAFGPTPAPPRPTRKHRAPGVSAETPAVIPGTSDVSAETPLPAQAPAVPQASDVSAEPPRLPPPRPARRLLAKTETQNVRPRPPQAGEGRGQGSPLSPPPPSTAPIDDPLSALIPPSQVPLPLPTPRAPAETADVLMPLPPRPPVQAPPGSALHEEAALLRGAIASLRVQHRPTDALAALTEHRHRFPAGALATDAQMLRVEALIALGRRNEALVALDDYRLAGEGPGGTLQVTRAELIADRNCPEAIAAFDDLIASATSSSPTIERALRGRAICHARLGNREAARRDWGTYLQRFPNGRFAAEANAGRNLIRQ